MKSPNSTLYFLASLIFTASAFAQNTESARNAENYKFFGLGLHSKLDDLKKAFPKAIQDSSKAKEYSDLAGKPIKIEAWGVDKAGNEIGDAKSAKFTYWNGELYDLTLSYDVEKGGNISDLGKLVARLEAKFGESRKGKQGSVDTFEWNFPEKHISVTMIHMFLFGEICVVTIQDTTMTGALNLLKGMSAKPPAKKPLGEGF